MKVAFLLNDLQLSGGVGVVVEHARQLQHRHGFESVLVLAREQDDPSWSYRGLTDLRVEALPSARRESFDVAVATWWETAFSLFELDAARYAYFLQSLEDRFYKPESPERIGAALTLDLPVDFITEARWIADTLRRTRPEARVFYVRNGIDKTAFPLPERVDVRGRRRPLHVLAEGYAQVWFKGVDQAAWAAGAMREPHHLTLVVPDREELPEGLAADEITGPVPREEMSELYARSDVVLKMSSVEGMFGPPLEGFHRGATCVVTPVTGHDEYVEHGWNGLVTEWDDLGGTARRLDLLAADRRFLHFLRTNAVETARGWPSWEQSGQFMAAALRRIRKLPPPQPSGRRLAADVRAAMEMNRYLVVQRNAMADELAPIWRVKRSRWYIRLRRVRHTRVGRVLTWPVRRLARGAWRRLREH
ncbi:MAG: glycosyltransferase family 4 protein [Thermoleophilaceae bacterium]